ncbi:MAG: YceI family protein [Planctomycetota bacterium]
MKRPIVRMTALLAMVAAAGTVVAVAATSPKPLPVQTTTATASAMTFDFKDPKGVNAISFMLDSELEPIVGFASGLSGTISYDPVNPESFQGALELDAGKINTSNPRMTSVLQGADWLDLSNHLMVRFVFSETIAVERTRGNDARLWVKGMLSVRGIEVEKVVMIDATYVEGGAARRGGAKEGDLLVLRSNFSIDRTEFNLKPATPFATVAQDIELNVAIAGYSK